MPTPDTQLSAEQSRQISETIREEIARRRISRQSLAEQAKLSLSTLEKVLGGRRPFTLATTVRLEQALGVSLRKALDAPAPAPAAPANGDVAPDSLGAYSRRAVTWLEGVYVTVRPSFGDKEAIYAYRTRWCSGKAKEPIRPTRNSAKSRCRTSRALSISSPTGTASTG
jgi:transcriptional regulator with XRE-family HTH domain